LSLGQYGQSNRWLRLLAKSTPFSFSKCRRYINAQTFLYTINTSKVYQSALLTCKPFYMSSYAFEISVRHLRRRLHSRL
jgi:hypothetical protein